MELSQLVKIVQQRLGEDEKCYLVGGAVRDQILYRKVQDYDFAVSGDPRAIARRVADQLKAAFFVMDSVRCTCRVILPKESADRQVMDFTSLQGDITSDLMGRDFTINAMAIDLTDPDRIIDPLKGGRDLHEKWLRPCSSASFIKDPVRIIRAARYAASLGLRIETTTTKLIESAVGLLDKVSLERQRDEFFKIVDSQNAITAVLLLEKYSILEKLGLYGGGGITNQLREFERFEAILSSSSKNKNAGFFSAASFQSIFYPFRNELSSHFETKNSNNHSRFQLDKFFLLIKKNPNSNLAVPIMQVFSNEELDWIDRLFKNESTSYNLLTSSVGLENRDCYFYYKNAGQVGIDLIFIGLAKIVSKPAAELEQHRWLEILARAEKLIRVWFEHPEIARPVPFVNGNEIMEKFNLQPGPLIGELLEKIKENQATSIIHNRKDAFDWLQNNL